MHGCVVARRAAGISVHPDGAALSIRSAASGGSSSSSSGSSSSGSGSSSISARLVVDCMGHFSPVVRQMRWGRKPDGVCIVVRRAGRRVVLGWVYAGLKCVKGAGGGGNHAV